MFELVHAYSWHDGPREGIAEYLGQPHRFESEWQDSDGGEDSYLLMPIDAATLALAFEDWAIWRRWETAFYRGEATLETHPALPEDRHRREELKRLLAPLLNIEPTRAVRVSADFRRRDDSAWNGVGWPPLKVEWTAL